MKKIQDIKNEITRITDEASTLKKGDKADIKRSKQLTKRLPVLRTCIAYLESDPKEAFIKQEISNVERKITLRMDQFPLEHYVKSDVDPKTVNKLKREHEKKYDIPKLREQVRTMRYILKS